MSDFPQTSISHSVPQPSHKGLWKLIHFLRYPANRQMEWGQKPIIKQSYLTCEAEGAYAGVLWGRWWLTCCNTCGSIQTPVWFYQAGIAYILTKLSNPSWGTDTLQENSTIYMWIIQHLIEQSAGFRIAMLFSLFWLQHSNTLECWSVYCFSLSTLGRFGNVHSHICDD